MRLIHGHRLLQEFQVACDVPPRHRGQIAGTGEAGQPTAAAGAPPLRVSCLSWTGCTSHTAGWQSAPSSTVATQLCPLAPRTAAWSGAPASTPLCLPHGPLAPHTEAHGAAHPPSQRLPACPWPLGPTHRSIVWYSSQHTSLLSPLSRWPLAWPVRPLSARSRTVTSITRSTYCARSPYTSEAFASWHKRSWPLRIHVPTRRHMAGAISGAAMQCICTYESGSRTARHSSRVHLPAWTGLLGICRSL